MFKVYFMKTIIYDTFRMLLVSIGFWKDCEGQCINVTMQLTSNSRTDQVKWSSETRLWSWGPISNQWIETICYHHSLNYLQTVRPNHTVFLLTFVCNRSLTFLLLGGIIVSIISDVRQKARTGLLWIHLRTSSLHSRGGGEVALHSWRQPSVALGSSSI